MSRHGSHRARRFVPRFEELESRWTPSCTTLFEDGTLLVFGDDQANTIALVSDGVGGISITCDSDTTTDFTGVENIVVKSKGGDDIVQFALSGTLTVPTHLNLNLGQGNDQLDLDLALGVAVPPAGEGEEDEGVKIDLQGGSGNDAVTFQVGSVTDTDLFFRANLGKGDDTFDATLLDALVGTASVRFNVQTHFGNDTFTVNATGVDVDASAHLSVQVYGHKGDDSVTVDYQGVLDGHLRLHVIAGLNDDTVAANLTADSGSTGSVKARVLGGPGNDTLILNVNVAAEDTVLVDALLNGDPGTDTLVSTDNVVQVDKGGGRPSR